MGLRVIFSVDVAEALRRGKPSSTECVIDLTESGVSQLSEADRTALADSLSHYGGSNADKRVEGAMAPEPSLSGLLESIAAKRAKASEKAAQQESCRQAAQAVMESFSDDEIATIYDQHCGNLYSIAVEMTGINGEPSHALSTMLKNRESEIEHKYLARKESENAAAEKVRMEREQHEREQKLAAENERAEWINTHGSNRLRRMLAEEIECTAVYRDERLAVERPGWVWYEDLPGVTDDPRNPPESAFATLDEARKIDAEAYMQRYTVKHVHDDCYDYEECPQYDVCEYVAESTFLGKTIVYMP